MSTGGEKDRRAGTVDDRLVLGLLFFPLLFVWALFRRGHSSTLRTGAAIYLGIIGIVALISILRH